MNASTRRKVLSRLALGAFAAALPAAASTVIPQRLDALAAGAESVVVATVGDQGSKFNDARTLILTETTLEIEETIAGVPAARLTVSEYGGQVGDLALVVPGLPRFEKGERVLLFLCRDALGLLRTCGAQQGRLRLRLGDDGAVRASGASASGAVDPSLEELRRTILEARGEARR